MFSTSDLADYLGVPRDTIISWRRLRIGPPPLRIVSTYFYPRHEVTAWLLTGGARAFGIALTPVHEQWSRAGDDTLPVVVERPGEHGLAMGI